MHLAYTISRAMYGNGASIFIARTIMLEVPSVTPAALQTVMILMSLVSRSMFSEAALLSAVINIVFGIKQGAGERANQGVPETILDSGA